jgi:hypothetical protein
MSNNMEKKEDGISMGNKKYNACIHTGFQKHDDYMTPKSAWENIQQFIPKDKVIWEAFYGDGKSGDYLKELGFKVIHQEFDFFASDLGEIIVTNPPFSLDLIKPIMYRLKELDKPFILILPSQKINSQYMRNTFKDKLQIIIPNGRINFNKLVGDKIVECKNKCAFDCFYYCYKMDLPNDITWL